MFIANLWLYMIVTSISHNHFTFVLGCRKWRRAEDNIENRARCFSELSEILTSIRMTRARLIRFNRKTESTTLERPLCWCTLQLTYQLRMNVQLNLHPPAVRIIETCIDFHVSSSFVKLFFNLRIIIIILFKLILRMWFLKIFSAFFQ